MHLIGEAYVEAECFMVAGTISEYIICQAISKPSEFQFLLLVRRRKLESTRKLRS